MQIRIAEAEKGLQQAELQLAVGKSTPVNKTCVKLYTVVHSISAGDGRDVFTALKKCKKINKIHWLVSSLYHSSFRFIYI